MELSDSLQVSVLTMSPGTELYSTFGHTAFRIKDLHNGYDIVFNYGTFDFNTKYFYFLFALGKLDYMLSVESFESFADEAREENRSLREQVLNFNKKQKMQLVDFLVQNYRPEKRFYRYKFFTDNCSTRIRDVIALIADDSLILERPKVKYYVTFQKLYTNKLEQMPWCKFGIGFLLGSLTQKQAGYDALFLPDNLEEAIGKAKIAGSPLDSKDNEIYKAKENEKDSFWLSPVLMSLMVLLLAISIQFKNNWTLVFDKIFFSLFGLFGLFITIVCIMSLHAELHKNFVILFLLPSHIILPFLKKSGFKKNYCLVTLLILVVSLLCIPVIPQSFSLSFILLSLALALRLFFNFKSSNFI